MRQGPDTPAPQRRSPAQRRHDAFAAALRTLLGGDGLPSIQGARPQILISIDLPGITDTDSDASDSDTPDEATPDVPDADAPAGDDEDAAGHHNAPEPQAEADAGAPDTGAPDGDARTTGGPAAAPGTDAPDAEAAGGGDPVGDPVAVCAPQPGEPSLLREPVQRASRMTRRTNADLAAV